MATVTDADGQPVSREQQIAALVASGMSEEYARFVVAVEQGDLPGDLLPLEDDGRPSPEQPHVD